MEEVFLSSRVVLKSVLKESAKFVNNVAVRGGGIHTSSSTIAVYQPGILFVTNNSADFGGGIYLEVSPKLYILKNKKISYNIISYFMNFSGNHAKFGGACVCVR